MKRLFNFALIWHKLPWEPDMPENFCKGVPPSSFLDVFAINWAPIPYRQTTFSYQLTDTNELVGTMTTFCPPGPAWCVFYALAPGKFVIDKLDGMTYYPSCIGKAMQLRDLMEELLRAKYLDRTLYQWVLEESKRTVMGMLTIFDANRNKILTEINPDWPDQCFNRLNFGEADA